MPRAVGRIVVCVDEIAEIITATTSTQPDGAEQAVLDREEEVVGVRLVAEARARRSPSPAYIIAATVTPTYVTSRMTVVSSAARPGMRLGSFVSSLRARHVSQPQ